MIVSIRNDQSPEEYNLFDILQYIKSTTGYQLRKGLFKEMCYQFLGFPYLYSSITHCVIFIHSALRICGLFCTTIAFISCQSVDYAVNISRPVTNMENSLYIRKLYRTCSMSG